ncbi:MAG: TolC family protein [bacterium]
MIERSAMIDSVSSLDDYLAFAIERSPALRSSYYNWKAASEISGYAGALPDPVLTYGYFIENVETRVGPQNKRVGLRQSFPWFGTLGAKKAMASEGAQAANHQFESERLRLIYQVKAAYYDYYFLAQDITITSANLELMTFWESVARTKYKTALGKHPDVIRAQVELGLLEDRLLSLQDMIGPAVARLRAAVNLPDSTPVSIPGGIAVAELNLGKTAIISSVREYNPNLRSIEHLIEKEKAGIRLAKKAYFPSFTVGVDYIETGPAMNPATPQSGKDPWIVGVGVNLPIWFGKNNARKQEAIARHKQAEYNLQDAENQLTAYTERALFEHNDALRKLRLYRDGLIPKAEQSLNASYTAYQAGELDFLNVLDAQRQLLEFQRQYERAKADLGIRAAELEMLTGKPTRELTN